jgi:hypothetical protein
MLETDRCIFVNFHCKCAREKITLFMDFRVKTTYWHEKNKMYYITNHSKHYLMTGEEHSGDPLK